MGVARIVGQELSKHLDPDINDELKGFLKNLYKCANF